MIVLRRRVRLSGAVAFQLTATALLARVVPHQVQGDAQQKGFGVPYARQGVRRCADIGLLDHILDGVRTYMDAQSTIQPGGVLAVKTVDALPRFRLQMLRIGHHGSPASQREGRESRRGRTIPDKRVRAPREATSGGRVKRQPSMI